jgi:type I restriction-modification system DNA methylase subunit
MAKVTYNERSWAIDVITEINVLLENKRWHFKKAGGESTIKNNKTSLFPDVLLFKDKTKDIIVQGWELKMPDTQINDAELISNAIKKAKILQRDSFLLWNVKSAVLYSRNGKDFEILKSWDDININNRQEVKPNEEVWKSLLFQILEDLNSYFESGRIAEITSKEILSIDDIIDVILENKENTSESIRKKAMKNARLDAEINQWWNSSSNEYGYKPNEKEKKFLTLSTVVLTDWVFKIVFANILKKHFNEAREIEKINNNTTIKEATKIINSISENCNFWNILNTNLAQKHISDIAWGQITQLNQFLSTLDIDDIEIEILHQLLQNSVASAKRKVAGQFSTPKKLADLLVRLTIDDKTKTVIDPCCGTGTIINQAYQLKEEYELNQDEILNTIWASDKHSFPIQLSTLSMAKPSNIGKIINVFNSDVIELKQGNKIDFQNPNNGELVKKDFPQIDYVVSNLPFIKNKEMKVLNPNILNINDWIQEQTETDDSLSGKSDIFAYIPFYLHQFLSSNGKIGLILSNAWLGTDYGEKFLELFQKFFKVEYVVISGKGKWFDNADVVTTILIAKKKEPKSEIDDNSEISFCTLRKELNEIENVKNLSDNILLGNQTENVIINKYSLKQISNISNIGLPWTGYFTNVEWLPKISSKIIKSKEFFKLTRGERRGWNAMFYPNIDNPIEKEYIKPVLKDLKSTKGLVATTNKIAFCCSKSIEELNEQNHTGAIKWINSFKNQSNNSGNPLTQSLKRANHFWYEMKTDSMADFVANVNYDKSLFIAKFEEPTFIDQRMIGFSLMQIYEKDKNILLALLNSTLGMFFIESYGFGRGLGALDLRAKKMARDFNVLNPNLLTEKEKDDIIEAFNPLLQRNRLPLEEEIESADRIHFENVLMEIYEISEYYESIKNSLMELYRIRFAVKN